MLQHVDNKKLLRMDAASKRQPAELQVDTDIDTSRGAEPNCTDVEG